MKTKQLFITLLITVITFMAAPVDKVKGDFSFQDRPKADFHYSPQIGYPPLIISFTNTSKGATDIKWTLVDYIIEEGAFDEADDQFVYIYNYPGTWPMYLSATNGAGTDVVVKYITVLDPGAPSVTVEFVAAPRAGPVGTEVQFYNVSPQFNSIVCGDCKFLWDFGDNSSSTDEDPAHTYTIPSIYTVKLSIFGPIPGYYGYDYYTEEKVLFIHISPASTSMISADFVATPVTGTPPHTVQFSNLSGGEAENILWDFGDGTSSDLLNPKHVYEEPGRYTVTLFIDEEEISKSDYVNILPSINEDQMCPAALVLNGDESQLSILRNFRDSVIKQSLPGQGLSELYYKHSLELVSILSVDEDIKKEAGDLLRELLPGLQSVIEGGTMTITNVQLQNIKILIGKIASQAGPGLGEVLAQLIIELTQGQFLEGIGIIVSAE